MSSSHRQTRWLGQDSDRRQIAARLWDWFDRQGRDLPWRGESDPYRIWVSEIMLQQTQAFTVRHYYQRWLAIFPDIATLARSREEKVLKLWEGLGYYARARHLHQAARIIRDRYQGNLPPSFEELRLLPGIGDYTAAAVASIAFGQGVGVVDGNVRRVVARLLADEGSSGSKKRIKTFIESTFFNHHPGWVNQAWMELGALVCRPLPDCPSCPLAYACRALALERVGDFPVKTPARKLPVRRGLLFLVLPRPDLKAPAGEPEELGRWIRGEHLPLLLVRRESRGLLGGLWGFPNIEEQLPDRFLKQHHLSLIQETGQEVSQRYSHFESRLAVLLLGFHRETQLEHWVEQRWILPEALSDLPRPRLHIRVMERFGLQG